MDNAVKKNIVVIGGGFAGVAAITHLLKHANHMSVNITLIDPNPYLLFTPSLYEVATSEEPQKNIAIAYKEIFGSKIEYIQANADKIVAEKHVVTTKDKEIPYDYLVISAGSVSAYHHIPGLEEHSIPLKSLSDAVTIKDKIKTMCCKDGECNRKTRLIVGGGGFSGTEFTAELLTYEEKLAKQFGLAKDCLQVTLIQGSDHVLNELDSHVSHIAEKRLTTPSVHFAFGGHVQEVTDTEVRTDDGKSYPYEIFVWTGGVEANPIAKESGLNVNKRGQVIVDQHLQVSEGIFAAGDIAEYTDPKTKSPVPGVGQVAEDQGKIAGENIYRSITNQKLLPYHFQHWGYIVPLKGRFAAAELMGKIHFDGFLGWVLQQLVFLRYLLTILPFWKAFKKWDTFEAELKQ